MNYEETMIAVKKDADANGIPYKCVQFSCVGVVYQFCWERKSCFRYMQFDSWWYYKDDTDRKKVTVWEAMPEIFPNGLR